jgi:hypothetical protein
MRRVLPLLPEPNNNNGSPILPPAIGNPAPRVVDVSTTHPGQIIWVGVFVPTDIFFFSILYTFIDVL